MDDYGISLLEGVKPEPNVSAALRVLTICHDLIDTVKVNITRCWLVAMYMIANTLNWFQVNNFS